MTLIITTAGHPDDTLHFSPISACGDIDDGVSLSHGNHGGWVISYQDLELMYLLAKRERKLRGELP